MKCEKYLIKKDKTDLLSSLKALNKEVLKEKIKEHHVDNINELKKEIIESFEFILESSIDDPFTQIYFQRLLEHENSEWMSAYEDDIESLIVFIYENNEHLSYYIPTEIKKIIKKLLYKIPTNEDLNLINASNIPVKKDLKKILDSLEIEDLEYIKNLLITNEKKNKTETKKELTKIIYETLTSEKKLSEIIEKLINTELNLLKELISEKGTIQNNNINNEEYYFLSALGIIFTFKQNNKFYISITNDVYKILAKMNLNMYDEIVEQNTKVYNLMKSMVQLYGAISYDDLQRTYNKYYNLKEETKLPDKVLYNYDRNDYIKMICDSKHTYFINAIMANEQTKILFKEIITSHQKIERKPIELNHLLKYSDFTYYDENKSINELKEYLLKHDISETNVDHCIINTINLLKLGSMFIESVPILLNNFGLIINRIETKQLLKKVKTVYNNTITWSNNGWTSLEIKKKKKVTK